jgi:response regulator RpfG family c-di-GMP phosphodiesterase
MNAKILFVDDEPNVLAGFERLFRKEFSIETALGGEAALVTIARSGPYAVIISDMRMPGMNGSELLARARVKAPDSIRMVLTGETDIGSAMKAVNDGAIFRFLMKPCSEPELRAAIQAGLRQYELQNVERHLLEKTLNGSIKVMTEVLSLVNPAAFGRSMRVRRYVRHVTSTLGLENAWQYDIAAMLSQLGCVTLPPATVESMYVGQGPTLTEEEQRRLLGHPSVAHDLLIKVPRLEPVARMILRQNEPFSAAAAEDPIALGAQILRVCLDFDRLVARGMTTDLALHLLVTRGGYHPRVLQSLADFQLDRMTYKPAVVPVGRLEPGMIVDEDIRTNTGLLLVARGHETTHPLLVRLKNFRQQDAIPANVRVLILAPGVDTEMSARMDPPAEARVPSP